MEISSAATIIGTFGATQQPLPRIGELQPEPSFAERIQGNRHVSFGSVFDASLVQIRENGNGGHPGRNSGTDDVRVM